MTAHLKPVAPRCDPWADPVIVLLEQLRAWKSSAYSCQPKDGRWLADCPVCSEHRAVRIDETRPGGSVLVRCRSGCTAAEIGLALDRAVDHADPWAQAAAWEQVAVEAQAVAHGLAELIDELLVTTAVAA